MLKITDTVYAGTTFHSCNSSFVVTREGAVVIDTPMVPVEAQEWKTEIEKFAPVRYVINNEAHTDHYCGNCYLGGTVIGTEETVKALKNARIEDLIGEISWMAPDSPKPDSSFYFRPPEISVKGDIKLYLGDHTFEILMVPGHTPQQLAVYVPEERIVFTSDNINLGMPIFVSAVPYEWLKSLDRLNELDVDTVVPGHGEVTDKSAFKQMKAQVQMWIDVVGRTVKAGLDLEAARAEINKAEEFAAFPKEGPAAGFFAMNVESLYKALKNG